MIVIASLIRSLREMGLTDGQILKAIEDAGSPDFERPPASRSERNRRYYESKRLKASEKRLNQSESETTESVLKASESVLIKTPLARVEDNPLPLEVSGKVRQGRISVSNETSSTKVDIEVKPKYPELFDEAWRAYPHVRGRSSKPKALSWWRKLPAAERQALAGACQRYAVQGKEPKAECGAPDMARWVRDRKFEDWLSPQAQGPPPAAIRLVYDPDFHERHRREQAK